MSTNNNTSIPLAGLATYTGIPQVTTGTTNIVVSIRADKLSELTIQQSANGVHWDLHEKWTCDPAKSPTGFVCQAPVGLSFFRVLLQNLEVTAMTTLRLISTLNNVSNVRLDVLRDNTLISGEDELGEKHTLLTDASGALIVTSSVPPIATQDVSVVTPLPAGTNSIGSVVISSTNSDIVIAGVSNQDGEYRDISVETELRPTPEPPNQTIYKLETYDYTANNTLTSIDTKVGLQGQNTDFAFFPDATNSTASIYADGQQPVATNQAGWVYTNNGVAPNKINWYVFQDVTLPQYLVSEMDSIYFVISQITPATTLPFVGFYTMPNGIDDVVPNFAKSKLVFAPSGAVPTAQGQYLFYVKSDPTHIRPEITNRYELTFNVANSTKTLAQAAGERLSLATLSTNSTDPVGSNYFLFQQYGITWAKTSVPLPVNNGLLDCNIVSTAPVVLATGTADIGYVRLTAENLLSNPSTFSNLQMVGANLEVEDQQAIGFLVSIDDNTNSMNATLSSIFSNSNGMVSRLTNIDDKMTTLSNGASTKTLTQTGTNWTAGSSTLQSLTLSHVGGSQFDYVKLYNKATAPDQNDTPVMTIPIHTDRTEQVVCNSLLFNLGIGVRATNDFVANDNTAPSGTIYATAFYKLG